MSRELPVRGIVRCAERHPSDGLQTFVPPRYSHSAASDFIGQCEIERSRSTWKMMRQLLNGSCWKTDGQDVAEYAIMLAVVLVIVMGVVRMIGSNAGTVFSQVASTIQ